MIDGTDLTASPGFIDTYAHSDDSLLVDPRHANVLPQGVTTEIIGPDGISYAQMSPDNHRMYRRCVSGILRLPPAELDMTSMSSFRSHFHGEVAINVACMVPHAAIRL